MEINYLQRVKSKCPACWEKVNLLKYWGTVDGVGIYVCDTCIRDLEVLTGYGIRVGLYYGFQKAKELIEKIELPKGITFIKDNADEG